MIFSVFYYLLFSVVIKAEKGVGKKNLQVCALRVPTLIVFIQKPRFKQWLYDIGTVILFTAYIEIFTRH